MADSILGGKGYGKPVDLKFGLRSIRILRPFYLQS